MIKILKREVGEETHVCNICDKDLATDDGSRYTLLADHYFVDYSEHMETEIDSHNYTYCLVCFTAKVLPALKKLDHE